MSVVNRFILRSGRELRTTMTHGMFIVAVHDAQTARVTSLAIRPDELATLRKALAVLSVEQAGRKRRRAEGA